MEQTNERAKAVAEEGGADGTKAGGGKKVERIARQSKGLIDDVKDWIDLKIELIELEIQEKIKARQDDAVAVAIIGFFGAMALVFLLVALALGLGAWLGHPAWGFLATTGLLGSMAGLLYLLRFARRKRKAPVELPDQKELLPPSDQKTLPAGSLPSDRMPEAAAAGSAM